MAKETIKNFNLHAPPGHPHGMQVYDEVFDFKHNFRFEIYPVSTYWGFGLRLSTSKKFEFSDKPIWKDGLPTLYIWVTRMNVDTDRDYYALHNKFIFGGHGGLRVGAIQLDDVGKQPALLKLRQEKETLFIDSGTNLKVNHSTRMKLGDYKYFKIVGFGEEKGFEIEGKMEITHKDEKRLDLT